MATFMLLVRDEGFDFSKLPPAEASSILKLYGAWSRMLKAAGRHKYDMKLADEGGKSLKIKGRDVVVDGPYADSKEVIGGFYIIEAENYDDAVEVAKGCPCLTYGGSVEIREADL